MNKEGCILNIQQQDIKICNCERSTFNGNGNDDVDIDDDESPQNVVSVIGDVFLPVDDDVIVVCKKLRLHAAVPEALQRPRRRLQPGGSPLAEELRGRSRGRARHRRRVQRGTEKCFRTGIFTRRKKVVAPIKIHQM